MAVTVNGLAVALVFHKDFHAVDKLAEIIFYPEEQICQLMHQHVEGCKISRRQTVGDEGQDAAKQTAGSTAYFAQEANQVRLIDMKTERVGGGRFQMVGFVHDQVLIFRQHTAARYHIGKEQGMVDHQNVGRLGRHAHFIKWAGAAGTGKADFAFAAFIFGREVAPDLAFSGTVEVDLTTVTGAALV
ncbi:hypothetical protein SDC9_99210 [bioreactor metagenome]|uniref:Uncharacterized protein n=1 Tax=bioreactor metagenome TaxID=1076179 RepID=A0A645AJH8_9ZZZZ